MFFRLFSTKIHSPVQQLDAIHQLSKAVNSTSSTLEKRAILLKYPDAHATLKRIYDPHLRHYVSAKTVSNYLKKHTNVRSNSSYQDLNQLLDALSSRQLTGHSACEAIGSFYHTYCKTEAQQNTFWHIIDRNLKMGVSTRTIRHILSHDNTETNPTSFNVALAASFSTKNFNLSDKWYMSQKLDGIRCITMIDYKNNEPNIKFYSRTGRLFTSLGKVKKEIQKRLEATKNTSEFVLDGEICAYSDENTFNEDFLKAMGQVRRTNEEMENPIYQVFDLINLQDFFQAKSDQTFCQRQQALEKFIEAPLQHVKLVKQTLIKSLEHLDQMKERSIQSGWEGLILRKEFIYEGKRTRNMLKLKEWEDAEYTVKRIETGMMRMPDTGENKNVLTNVIIEHKGNTVSVGSGFSMQSRIAYAEDPSLIIGKPITVRYFSESFKENGAISLRFPTVKAVYEEGERDV
ncbi:uncharacterized protein B0P05DRAFT_580904 [Gilbertella persicaria]|uniref:uncharacterized protein n=1 Tax=Gilbertella persicaria TaxID=101096 RepID=UPI00221F99E2|nr:uncharacterized protein B0P05DRAFT_580904 [Gilbertella persicaria]KAI8065338.1 hypothetical protein B0P05DRAFT_580904 [Gilbertella persicaria]